MNLIIKCIHQAPDPPKREPEGEPDEKNTMVSDNPKLLPEDMEYTKSPEGCRKVVITGVIMIVVLIVLLYLTI